MNKKIVAPLLLSTLLAWRALAHFNFMSNHSIAFCAGVVGLLILCCSFFRGLGPQLATAQDALDHAQALAYVENDQEAFVDAQNALDDAQNVLDDAQNVLDDAQAFAFVENFEKTFVDAQNVLDDAQSARAAVEYAQAALVLVQDGVVNVLKTFVKSFLSLKKDLSYNAVIIQFFDKRNEARQCDMLKKAEYGDSLLACVLRVGEETWNRSCVAQTAKQHASIEPFLLFGGQEQPAGPSDLSRKGGFLDCRPKTLGEQALPDWCSATERSIDRYVTHVAL
jgi:hypothetical protein